MSKFGSISRSRFSLSCSLLLPLSELPLCSDSSLQSIKKTCLYFIIFTSNRVTTMCRFFFLSSDFHCRVEKKSITADWWYQFLLSPVVSDRFPLLFCCRPSAELSCLFTIKLTVKPELCATSKKLCVQSYPPVIPASWSKRVKTAKTKLVFQFKVLSFWFCCSESRFLGESWKIFW